MKNVFGVLLVSCALLVLTHTLSAQEHPGRDHSEARVSPNGFVEQTIGTTQVSIAFGRPHARGRDLFGSLQPYGAVWRAGANEATTIVFPSDVKIEGKSLPAGAYALFTIPEEDEWTVIFNSQAKQWGHFRHDPEKDVLRVTVKPREAHHQEMLLYSFENVTNDSATIVLHWGTTQVPFQVAIAE